MARPKIDVDLDSLEEKDFLIDKHIAFILKSSSLEIPTTNYLKASGVYWCSTVLDLLGAKSSLNKTDILDYIVKCQKDDGGYAPHPTYESHILYVLSAVQVFCLYDSVEKIDKDKIGKYIKSLQLEDGSFVGDKWGEIDTRFCFCAVASLALLNMLPVDSNNVVDLDKECVVDLKKLTAYLVSCQNIDGGFGTRPGSESHGGQAYCVIGALSILGKLNSLNVNKAAWWLAERQLPSGGLNGRPEKHPDVCYSWWVLASLAMLGRLEWINAGDLARFIMASQDEETGGISDRPGNYPDPFHTLFGIAGLSLLSRIKSEDDAFSLSSKTTNFKIKPSHLKERIGQINPVYCMPNDIIDKIQPPFQIIKN